MQFRKGALIFVFLVIFLQASLFSGRNSEKDLAFLAEERRLEEIKIVLDSVPVFAKAVSVYDVDRNKKVYGRNDEERLPIASLSKMMTVLVSLNEAGEEKRIPITANALDQFGDYGFLKEEEWTTANLSKFTLLASANDAAYALSENSPSFVAEMNTKAKKIGMENTSFLNSTGLDINKETAGAFASASDVNKLAVYGFTRYPKIFGVTTFPETELSSESGLSYTVKNTNVVLNKIPNLLFSKTGYTELAGGNLTIIFKNKKGENLAVTALGSTFDGRFMDMESLANTLYTLYSL